MKSVDQILKTIQKKNSLCKNDLNAILELNERDQQHIIEKISKTRQKKLLDYLTQVPYLDEQFNFPLSRRESFQSSQPDGIESQQKSVSIVSSESPGDLKSEQPVQTLNLNSLKGRPQLAQLQFKPPANPPGQTWRSNLQQLHNKFTFDQVTELQPVKEKEPFQSTADPYLKVLKRIMYAEGDSLLAGDEEAKHLSYALENVVNLLKHDNDLYLPLFYFIFEKEIAKFQATKRLTKGVKEKPEFDQEEEAEEEFSQNSDDEDILSSKSLSSYDDNSEMIPQKQNQPLKDSKKILEELEQSDSGQSALSQDYAEEIRERKDLDQISEKGKPTTMRQHFMYLRVREMSDETYQQFLLCRQTKVFSRGIQPVLDKFGLTRLKSLSERKVVEMFGYIFRVIISKIVFKALQVMQNNEVKPLSEG